MDVNYNVIDYWQVEQVGNYCKIRHYANTRGNYVKKYMLRNLNNAIVYTSDGNQTYVDCMVNSINSLYENNPKFVLDTL